MNEKNKTDEKPKSIYFIGIGGIGMSALARYFHSKGAKVSGYDKTPSSLTKELEQEGMNLHYEERIDLVPKDAELVIYTPAVPKEHKELVYYQQNGYKVVKRSDVLQVVTEGSFNICIAGTHGKTTITTMIAHLLRHTGYGCNAFLGGISVNYGTNFWPDERNVSVVEADEYDRSFLKLSPDIAIITAMDPDHLDVYGTTEQMEQAFIDFSSRIKPGGLLIGKFGLARTNDLNGPKKLTYSVQNSGADAYAANIKMINGSYEFDVMIKDKRIEKVKLNVGGMHNVENAVAAVTAVSSLNIDKEKIRAAVADFKGVKRRFEYIIPPSPPGAGKGLRPVFIDDYAHHPEELRALISGAKSLFSDRRSTIIFQPHLYTRTRDLADGFAEVLDLADEVILLPIYPARELPITGVNSEMILRKMKNRTGRAMTKDELMKWVEVDFKQGMVQSTSVVLITAGAGDIDTMVDPIRELLLKSF